MHIPFTKYVSTSGM